MSTHSPAAMPPMPSQPDVQIKIVSHSNLFYWWPVWAVGFLMAIFTWFEGHHMAVLPAHTTIVKLDPGEHPKRFELRFPHDPPEEFLKSAERSEKDEEPFRLRISANKLYGAIFAVTLLMVIVITNAPMRGMWSILIIVVAVLMAIIFGLAGWWEGIIQTIAKTSGIHIDFGGYLFISLVLLAIWLVNFFFFDQQVYMIFTPGQLKVRLEIGGGEKAYDTAGMTIEKQRSDLFRHWILGLGSGDLIVNTSGAQAHHFDVPNVLFVGKKVQEIEDMLREKVQVPRH